MGGSHHRPRRSSGGAPGGCGAEARRGPAAGDLHEAKSGLRTISMRPCRMNLLKEFYGGTLPELDRRRSLAGNANEVSAGHNGVALERRSDATPRSCPGRYWPADSTRSISPRPVRGNCDQDAARQVEAPEALRPLCSQRSGQAGTSIACDNSTSQPFKSTTCRRTIPIPLTA